MKIRYVGKKERIELNLPYMNKKIIFDSENEMTAEINRFEAERLVSENPRSFRMCEPVPDTYLSHDDLNEMTMLEICNYAKVRLDMNIKPSGIRKAELIEKVLKRTP